MNTPHRLIQAREQAGLSIGQAARLLEIERDRLLEWETSVLAPTPDELTRLSDLYDVNIHWLTGNDTGPNAPYLEPALIAMLDGMKNRADAERLMELFISLKRDDEVAQ